jgi:hypothetical protein
MLSKKLIILGGAALLAVLIFLSTAGATDRCVVLELMTNCS